MSSPLHPAQLMAMLPGHQKSAAPRSLVDKVLLGGRARRRYAITAAATLNTHIHMQPQVVLLTDVSDLVDGVKRAIDRRTGGGVDEEGHVTLRG